MKTLETLKSEMDQANLALQKIVRKSIREGGFPNFKTEKAAAMTAYRAYWDAVDALRQA